MRYSITFIHGLGNEFVRWNFGDKPFCFPINAFCSSRSLSEVNTRDDDDSPLMQASHQFWAKGVCMSEGACLIRLGQTSLEAIPKVSFGV